MKKIIIGLIQTTASPFIVILGANLISSFNAPKGAFVFASILGGISVLLNLAIGCGLILKGYQEQGSWEGW